MTHHHISRRAVLAGSAAAGALALTGTPARSEINWTKYAGTKLEANLVKGPRGELLQDFYFVRQANALHVLNAPSPAATASLAIADEIIGLAPEAIAV